MFNKLIIILIRAYQLLISSWMRPSCRYTPSCSQYAIIAFSKYGIIKGFLISVRRLMRCHPFAGSGHDPVP